jgi:tetratricopeptide (TPR) repeat protein
VRSASTRSSALTVLASLALAWHAAQQPSDDARRRFEHGVTALHNFAYVQALADFQQAQRADPDFAMAYWGEAMAHNQSLWLSQDREAALLVLQRLGRTPDERAAKAASPKEKQLLAALDVLFGAGADKAARDLAYAEAMGRIHAAHPEDPDVASFYALALLATAHRSPALFSESNEEAHQHALVGSATQRRVAEVLERVLRAHPAHPGALHYTIHNYDDPAHAKLALPAARAYAKAAAGSSHALHMPAHVFVQLGMWHEAAASDEASFVQSLEWARQNRLGVESLDYHSLSWLCYETLQQGRLAKAREALELIRPAVSQIGAPRLKAILSVMRAQYVVETRAWDMLRGQSDFSSAAELFAIGLAAAETGQAETAARARSELLRRSQGQKLDAAIMEKELGAVLELRAGRGEQAAALIQEAAGLEKTLPPPLGPPRPVKPSYELQGEVLLELGRAKEAAAAFEQSLARWPNRSASLLGLARALVAAGNPAAARERYRELLANWSRADAGVNGLDEARRAVARK